METYIDDYRYIAQLHDGSEQAFHDVMYFARTMYPGSGISPWKRLFDGASDIFYADLADDRLKIAVREFTNKPSPPQAQNLCKAMEAALRLFTKNFTENHLAKRPEYWEVVRDYYANKSTMVAAGRYDDLKKVHDALAQFLNQLATIAQLMERSRRDLFPDGCDIDLLGLTAEMSYWSEYIGQWFNHIWSSIPAEGSQAAQTTYHQQGQSAQPAGGQAQPVGSAAASQSPQQSFPAPVGQPAAPGAVVPRRPVVPKIEKAKSRKSAEAGLSRKIPLFGRFINRETASLGPDAELIANALKYNRLTMLLLLRRIRKDMASGSPDNIVKHFHSYLENVATWARREYVLPPPAELVRLLNAAENAIDGLEEWEGLIRNGGNAGALVHAADAAEACNIALRELGKHLDESISEALSPLPAARAVERAKDAIRPNSPNLPDVLKDVSTMRLELKAISEKGHKGCAKVLKIVERINQIIADKDFTRKHLTFQGVGRITGYAVSQESITPTCMNTIEDDIRKTNTKAKDVADAVRKIGRAGSQAQV